MKHFLIILSILFCFSTCEAQAPLKMSYQAVIRNNVNALLANQTVGMRISVLQTSASGTPVFIETQTPTTNENGLVSLEIGAGNLVIGNFSSIDWSNGPYFIKTETDLTGGNNYSIISTQQLLSVPYALYASTSGSSIPGPQGLQGPQGLPGPTGLLTSGATAGNTPYWNGASWVTGSSNFFNNGGNIGIGTINPQSKFHIVRELNGSDNIAFRTNITSLGGASDNLSVANWTTIQGTIGDLTAVEGNSSGLNSLAFRTGVLGIGSEGLYSRGVEGQSVEFNDNPNNVNEGLVGFARNSNFSNMAVYGRCYDDESPTGLGDHYGLVGISECLSSAGVNYGVYAEAFNAAYNYAGFFNGDVIVAGTLNNPSDERLKTNIKPMKSSLDIIRQLTPVEYDYKQDESIKLLNLSQKHQYGFIAQDLQQVLPDLVSNQKLNSTMHGGASSKNESKMHGLGQSNESMEFLGINYTSIIPFLVQGMKEQDEKIRELESVVMELKQQVEQNQRTGGK